MRMVSRRRMLGGALAAPFVLSASGAFALDRIRFGKSVPNSFAFSTAEIGTDAKIWEQEGLELAVSAFRGDAQMQQVGVDRRLGERLRSRGCLSASSPVAVILSQAPHFFQK